MKNQQRQVQSKTVNCREHKEKCTFVCLHKTCPNSFKIGCQKCRKEHAQHPNRLISIADFHKMLCKPIQYLQNSTAFKLMNLKKKIEHIRNFRTSILQKQILLIESNQGIKTTTSAILQQHYKIRDVVSHIDTETLAQDHDRYQEYLHKCREFLAYNPVKGNLVFNNEVIKNSRVILEKHIQTSHELIDSIRQFLIKIIEVLLANCAYDEDDDDIEFDNEGQDATSFNIVIKNRTDVSENPNIKNKIEHEAFLQMFDQEKDALNQQINILQRQLDFKVNILNKIRSTGSVSKTNPQYKNEQEEECSLSENDNEKISVEELKPDCKGDSAAERDALRQQILQLKEEYETVLSNKEHYIQELKDTHKALHQKLEEKELLLQQSNNKTIKEEELKAEIDDLLKDNSIIQDKLAKLEKIIGSLNKKCQQRQSEIFELTNKLSSIGSQSATKSIEVSQNQQLLLEQMHQKQQEYINQILRMKQQIEKKDKEISKHKKKYSQLESLVQKMRENNAHSEQELLQWRRQHQLRQKRLREEVEFYQHELQNVKIKLANYTQKLKAAQQQAERLNQEVSAKVEFIRQGQKQLESKQLEIKQLTLKLSVKKQEGQDLAKRSQAQSTVRRHEQENKKIRQMKEMLEMSIRKNQELKDKIYELETALEDSKYQLKKANNSRVQSSHSDRRAFCDQLYKPQGIQASELVNLPTVNSQFIDHPSASFKQNGSNHKFNAKGTQKQAYLEIKNIFKAVTDDMKILEQRLKENNVIEKVYLKELERKRNENKNLKKELQNVKLYGINPKNPDIIRSSSPLIKEDKNKVGAKSPFKLQAQQSTGGAKKAIKSPK